MNALRLGVVMDPIESINPKKRHFACANAGSTKQGMGADLSGDE